MSATSEVARSGGRPSGQYPHIPSLDGIRAVSILIVFLAHAGFEEWVPGGFGVTIFFFLSGFLITTLLRVEFERHGKINLRHFWLRRVLRILPPFYLVLGLMLGLTLWLHGSDYINWQAVKTQALHYVNYWMIDHGTGGIPPGTGVYWSLAVEEHFYLAFPWLYVALARSGASARTQAMTFLGLCAVTLIWRSALVFLFDASEGRTYHATDTRLDSILYGCVLAVWRNPVLDGPPRSERTLKWICVPAAIAALAACLLFRDPAFRETARYSIQGIALAPLFVAAISYPNWGAVRVLNWRPIAFVGVLSYSIYLVHFAAILWTKEWFAELPPLAQMVIALVASLALSYVIYRLVERPCASLRRRLEHVI